MFKGLRTVGRTEVSDDPLEVSMKGLERSWDVLLRKVEECYIKWGHRLSQRGGARPCPTGRREGGDLSVSRGTLIDRAMRPPSA